MATLETNIQQRIRLHLSNLRCKLFRNHVGVIKDQNGRTHRFGLYKGSSDLIGWTPVEITQDMVGSTVAVFTAIEVKTPKGRPSREQKSFIAAVARDGGFAGVARSPDQAADIIAHKKAPKGEEGA